MYYNGQNFDTNSLSDAMTLDAVSDHRPPRNRVIKFTNTLTRIVMLAPYVTLLGFAAYLGIEYGIHALFG